MYDRNLWGHNKVYVLGRGRVTIGDDFHFSRNFDGSESGIC